MSVSKPTIKDCRGCRDDFYNGKNPLGVKRCWMLDDAKFEWAKDIPIDLPPPYGHIKPTRRPNCYGASREIRMFRSTTKKGASR